MWPDVSTFPQLWNWGNSSSIHSTDLKHAKFKKILSEIRYCTWSKYSAILNNFIFNIGTGIDTSGMVWGPRVGEHLSSLFCVTTLLLENNLHFGSSPHHYGGDVSVNPPKSFPCLLFLRHVFLPPTFSLFYIWEVSILGPVSGPYMCPFMFHLIRLSPLFQPVKIALNIGSVIQYTYYPSCLPFVWKSGKLPICVLVEVTGKVLKRTELKTEPYDLS